MGIEMAALIPAIIGAGGSAGAAAINKYGGGNKTYGVNTPPPVYPKLQDTFGKWLEGQVGKGATPYPGEITAKPNSWLDSAGSSLNDWMKSAGQMNIPGAQQGLMTWLQNYGNRSDPNSYASKTNQAVSNLTQNNYPYNEWMNTARGLTGDMPDYWWAGADKLGSWGEQGGKPITALPAWQQMVEANDANVMKNAARLREQFNMGGNRYGSGYAEGMQSYFGQAAKDENAMLAEMTRQGLESAQGRAYGSDTNLANLMNSGANLQATNYRDMVSQFGDMAKYQTNRDISGISAILQQQGLNLQAANQLSGLLSNIQQLSQQGPAGFQAMMQLGTMLTGLDDRSKQALYQEFMRTQPENGPLLQMLFQGSLAQPGSSGTPVYQQSPWAPLVNSGIGIFDQWARSRTQDQINSPMGGVPGTTDQPFGTPLPLIS